MLAAPKTHWPLPWIKVNRFTQRLLHAVLSADPPLDGLHEAGFHFTLNGEFGARYQIEVSPDGQTWSSLATITNLYGTTQILDSAATGQAQKFYRALQLN